MGFERYEREAGPTTADPRVSLRASGSIGLNNAAVDAYLADAAFATLYHDEAGERVGIEPTESDDPDAYSVQRGEEPTHGATLNAAGFMREYDLLPAETTTYPAEWDDDAGLVAVDLERPVERGDDGVRPGPTEPHATVSWVDDVRGAANVLLLAPDGVDDCGACAHLLDASAPDRTGLLVVTRERSADEWLSAVAPSGPDRPAEVAVVDVDPAAGTASTTERADGVTVSVVPEEGDLTGIGIALADHGTAMRDAVSTLVVCVDSASGLLAGADDDRVLDFFEVVTGKIRDWGTGSTDVRAHYHLSADAHRPETTDAFARLADATVTLDDEGEVAGVRR